MRRVAGPGVALVMGLVLSVGCESEPTERSYSVPDDICGLDLPQELYTPLFPPGSEVAVEGAFPSEDMGIERCRVTVDEEVVISVDTSGFDEIEEYLSVHGYDYAIGDATSVNGEFDALAWPGLTIAHTPCEPGTVLHAFMVAIQADHPDDEEESVRILSDLIQPLMRAAVDASQCDPGPATASAYSSS
jgi:hypothetical protein